MTPELLTRLRSWLSADESQYECRLSVNEVREIVGALEKKRADVIEECVKALEAEFASERGGYDPSREYTAAQVMEAYYTAGHRATAAVCKLRGTP